MPSPRSEVARWAALALCALLAGCAAFDEAVRSAAAPDCRDERRLEEAVTAYAEIQRLAPEEAVARYRHLSSTLAQDCTDRRLQAAMLLTRRDVASRFDNGHDDLLAVCLKRGEGDALARLASILQAHMDEAQANIARQRRLEQELSHQHQQIEALKAIERSIQDRGQ